MASSDPSKAASVFSARTLAEAEEIKQDKSEFVLIRDALAALKSNDFDDGSRISLIEKQPSEGLAAVDILSFDQ